MLDFRSRSVSCCLSPKLRHDFFSEVVGLQIWYTIREVPSAIASHGIRSPGPHWRSRDLWGFMASVKGVTPSVPASRDASRKRHQAQLMNACRNSHRVFPPTRVAHGRKCSRGCRSDGVPPPAGKTKDRSWHAAPLTTQSFCGYQPAFYSFESYAGSEGPLTEFKPPLTYREKDRETVREIYRR